MTTNQNEPGAPDGWNYGSGDCLNPACATYGGQGTFKRRKGSTDPRVCSTCAQPERGSIETNGSFKPATNGHHVPNAAVQLMQERDDAAAELIAELESNKRPPRPWEPPAVLPGATTALQARCDELAAALAAAQADLAPLRAEVARLREHIANVANRRGDLVEKLNEVCAAWSLETFNAARAALDSTAPAPRPAIEALVAAVGNAIEQSWGVFAGNREVPRTVWDELCAAHVRAVEWQAKGSD